MSGHAESAEHGETEHRERGEQGEVGYPYPPERDDTDVVGARIGAQVIDTVVMFVVVWFTITLFGGLGGAAGEGGGAGGAILGFFVGLVLALSYTFILEAFWDGHTVGKYLLNIKVVEEDGSECSIVSAFIRNLFRLIDGLFYYLVGFLVMAASDRRQRLGDRLAGTVVVREQ